MGSNLLLNSLRSRLGAKFNLMDSASGRQSREAVRQKKEEPGPGRDGSSIQDQSGGTVASRELGGCENVRF